MKANLFSFLSVILLSISSVYADKVQIGGLYYNLDDSPITPIAEVTSSDNYYSGLSEIDIPTSVTYNSLRYSVTSIGERAFYLCNGLTLVIIPSSITGIGEAAFEGCSGLVSITIPSSVTSIGQRAFVGCSGITSITIPSSVTNIISGAFANCSGLTSISVEAENTSYDSRDNCNAIIETASNTLIAGCQNTIIPSSVTNIGQRAFFGCSGLASITIPSNVISIDESSFGSCSGLTSMSVEAGNAVYDSRDNCNAIIKTASNILVAGCKNTIIPSGVTNIGKQAFKGHSGLISLTIPSSVTSIGDYAFDECTGLTSINIPNSVISIGNYAFNECSSMTAVDIPSSVSIIERYAFSKCSSLTSIDIPSNVASIENGAFSDCTGLTSITCRATSAPELGSSAFSGVDMSIPIYVPSNSISAYQAVAQWGEFTNIQAIPASGENSDIIASGTCGAENNLTWELRGDSVLTISGSGDIGQYSTSNAAPWNEYKVSIKRLIVNSGVTSVGDFAFYGCNNLSSASLPESLTSIKHCGFAYCGLREITIPDNVTELGTQAFLGNSNLTSLTIPRNVTSIGTSLVQACSKLTAIIVDTNNPVYDSRENCNAIIHTSDNALVVGCMNTTIAQSITSFSSTAFMGCYGLTSIVIPNQVTHLGSSAFSGCIGLKSIVLPDNITEIADALLFGCTDLESITIPQYVTSIGKSALLDCNQLASITCQATTPPTLGETVFQGIDKSIPLYVPSESVDAYKAATGWNEFSSIRAVGGSSGGNNPMFPDDPGTLTYSLELSAAVVDGDELPDYAPTGAGGYPQGTSVTITAQDIPGYAFVRWSDEVTDKSRTVVVNESLSLTALYSHPMIEIPIAAGQWNFICLPPLGDRQYTEDMFTYDGLTDVQWGTYNGEKRAAGQSGWETPETFNALQGYILYSTTAGTLRINAYVDDIGQGESGSAIQARMLAYSSSHPENESWNILGNPYSQGFNIAGLAATGIESPITVWNGTAYSTYTPGIDQYTLNPFEAFFIQKAENGAETITFSREYLEGGDSGSGSGGSADDGALSGAFSVAAGRQVHFSKGNLQYQASTNTWRFAENQYDVPGTNSGWIDLFGWGTGNNPTLYSKDNNDFSTFVDWGKNAISNGGNEANLWRTLTNEEWAYLSGTRANASALFGHSTVNGISGLIILPDDWQNIDGLSFTPGTGEYSQNIYTIEQWSMLESAGAVFLPTSGERNGTVMNDVGLRGSYWSATSYNESYAYYFFFNNNYLTPQNFNVRYYGRSVRLVR